MCLATFLRHSAPISILRQNMSQMILFWRQKNEPSRAETIKGWKLCAAIFVILVLLFYVLTRTQSHSNGGTKVKGSEKFSSPVSINSIFISSCVVSGLNVSEFMWQKELRQNSLERSSKSWKNKNKVGLMKSIWILYQT